MCQCHEFKNSINIFGGQIKLMSTDSNHPLLTEAHYPFGCTILRHTYSFACLVPDTYIKQKTLSLSLAFLEKNSKGVNMQLNSVLHLNRVFCFKI